MDDDNDVDEILLQYLVDIPDDAVGPTWHR